MRKICLLALFIVAIAGCKKDMKVSSGAGATQSSIPDSMVATPAGFLPKSHIHLIENGYRVEVRGGHVLKVSISSGKTAEDFGEIHQAPVTVNSKQTLGGPGGNTGGSKSITVPDDVAVNWQTYAQWHNTSTMAISQFNTTWTVPNNPTIANDGQLIFIFNALQQAQFNSDIMQPVLQWGNSAAGNAQGWGIANWYGWNNSTYFAISALQPVNAGASLTGILQRTGTQADGSVNYTSSFSGQPNALQIVEGDVYANGFINNVHTQVTIPKVNTEAWAFETLEVYNTMGIHNGYGPTQANDYPADADVRMTNVNIWLNGYLGSPSWTAEIGPNAWFGENTYLAVNGTNGNGEVDLYFHPRPAPNISYTTPIVVYTGNAISSIVPTNTGGPVTTYTVSPALPAGLTIDPTYGIINGTPTTATAAANYVVTATNTTGSSSFTINITVKAATVAINGLGSYNWNNGNGTGSGTITAPAGYLVHVTISAYGPGTTTNFTLNGATLSGGSPVTISNNSTTRTFTMPSGGSVTWSGSFTRTGSSGTGDIAVN